MSLSIHTPPAVLSTVTDQGICMALGLADVDDDDGPAGHGRAVAAGGDDDAALPRTVACICRRDGTRITRLAASSL